MRAPPHTNLSDSGCFASPGFTAEGFIFRGLLSRAGTPKSLRHSSLAVSVFNDAVVFARLGENRYCSMVTAEACSEASSAQEPCCNPVTLDLCSTASPSIDTRVSSAVRGAASCPNAKLRAWQASTQPARQDGGLARRL